MRLVKDLSEERWKQADLIVVEKIGKELMKSSESTRLQGCEG